VRGPQPSYCYRMLEEESPTAERARTAEVIEALSLAVRRRYGVRADAARRRCVASTADIVTSSAALKLSPWPQCLQSFR
jgi:hypothetical protein